MKNQCSLINKFMYVKSCYKRSTFKNDKSNSNNNICNILHLPFYMLFYFLKRIMIPCKMHWQSDSPSEQLAVQNRAWYDVITTRQCVSLFLLCKNFKHEKKISNTINMWFKSNSYSNISQYYTYLLTWCWNITNNLPVVFWNAYCIKRKIIHEY